MKCLFNKTAKEFLNYVKYDLKKSNWEIMDDSIENRYDYICQSKYAAQLEEIGYELDLFQDDYDNFEIVAWIDSYAILYRILNKVSNQTLENLHVIAEYNIPNTNNRCDILLVKDNKILILEFKNEIYSKHQIQNAYKQVKSYYSKINKLINNKNIIIESEVIFYGQEYQYNEYEDIMEGCLNDNENLVEEWINIINNYFYETTNFKAIDYLTNEQNNDYIQSLLNEIENLKRIINEKEKIIKDLKTKNTNDSKIIYKKYYKGIVEATYNGYTISLHENELYHNYTIEIAKIYNDGTIDIEFNNGNQKNIRIIDLDCFN